SDRQVLEAQVELAAVCKKLDEPMEDPQERVKQLAQEGKELLKKIETEAEEQDRPRRAEQWERMLQFTREFQGTHCRDYAVGLINAAQVHIRLENNRKAVDLLTEAIEIQPKLSQRSPFYEACALDLLSGEEHDLDLPAAREHALQALERYAAAASETETKS